MAENKKNTDAVMGIFILLALGMFAFTVWLAPIAVLLAVIMLFLIRDNFIFRRFDKGDLILKITKIVIYLIAVCFIILEAAANLKWFADVQPTYKHYFSCSALNGEAGFKQAIYFFKNATFKQIFIYCVAPTFLIACVLFSLGRVFYFFSTLGDPRKKLLKKRRDAKPNFKRLEKVFFDKNYPAVPLGVNLWTNGVETVSVPHSMLKRHVCLVGTTGSGKTVTLYNFIYNALLNSKPIVFIDGKGDKGNIEKFKKFCGYFKRPASVITIDGETGYNPFQTGTPTELTDKIISMFDWSEEHYKLTATRFIQLLITYIQLKGIPCTLPNIIKFSDIETLNDYHQSQLEVDTVKIEPAAGATNVFDTPSFENPKSDKESGSHLVFDKVNEDEEIIIKIKGIERKSIQGIQARIATLAEGDMRRMFENSDSLNLLNAIEGGQAVLFSLDSLRYPQQAKALGRLIVNDIKTCVSFHERTGSSPVGLFFDEFNVFASHEIVDIINKSRSAGFEAMIAFQSLSDIDKLDSGEALRRQIVQNCNTLIVQLQNDSHDAEQLSSLFGTYEDIEQTVQVEGSATTGLSSFRKVHQYSVHPDEIKKLSTGQAFIKITGYGITKIQIAMV